VGLLRNLRDPHTRWSTVGVLTFATMTLAGSAIVLAILPVIAYGGEVNAASAWATILIALGATGTVVYSITLARKPRQTHPPTVSQPPIRRSAR
jgi:hypothetical protein